MAALNDNRLAAVKALLGGVPISDAEIRWLAGSMAGRQSAQSIATYIRKMKHKPDLRIVK